MYSQFMMHGQKYIKLDFCVVLFSFIQDTHTTLFSSMERHERATVSRYTYSTLPF